MRLPKGSSASALLYISIAGALANVMALGFAILTRTPAGSSAGWSGCFAIMKYLITLVAMLSHSDSNVSKEDSSIVYNNGISSPQRYMSSENEEGGLRFTSPCFLLLIISINISVASLPLPPTVQPYSIGSTYELSNGQSIDSLRPTALPFAHAR